ncbi:MAG: adenylate kinase [Candidatus Aenigmarchaeota archaeon]
MNMIFLGPPGIGKGTQAEVVSRKYGIPRISTGEIMREEVKRGTELGKEVKGYMARGELVPDELVMDITKKRVMEGDCERGFVLDGVPRTVRQAEELGRVTKIDIVLNLVTSEKVILERMAGRLTCRKCGAVYHKKSIPPKREGVCDRCRGELYQREDQSEKVVEKRLEMYEKETKPLVEYYKKKGILIEVNAEGGKEDVVKRTEKVIQDFLKSRERD